MKLIAKFQTILSAGIAYDATSLVMTSNLTKDGTVMLAGLYGFVISEGTASEEYVIGSFSGLSSDFAITGLIRGVSYVDGKTSIPALRLPHRKSSTIKMTDHPYLLSYVNEINAGINAPEGFVINGQISATVLANVLTVALKGLDGNDPSPANPVYVRIGNVVRAVTYAVSVSSPTGSSWLNLGSAEHVNLDHDLFAYLEWETSVSLVRICFSRIPCARTLADFDLNAINEKAAISNRAGTVLTDLCVNIGRFNAQLNTSNLWAINSPVIINRPCFESRWLTWTPTLAKISAYSTAQYKVFGEQIKVIINSGAGRTVSGGSGVVSYTLPFSTIFGEASSANVVQYNGTAYNRPYAYISSNTFVVLKDAANTNWAGGESSVTMSGDSTYRLV